jgi:hypothetical protein
MVYNFLRDMAGPANIGGAMAQGSMNALRVGGERQRQNLLARQDQRAAEMHPLEMQSARQAMDIRGQQERRAAEKHPLEIKAARQAIAANTVELARGQREEEIISGLDTATQALATLEREGPEAALRIGQSLFNEPLPIEAMPPEDQVVELGQLFAGMRDGFRRSAEIRGLLQGEQPQVRQITGEEAAAIGLDPNRAYNVDPDGKITAIGSSQTSQEFYSPEGQLLYRTGPASAGGGQEQPLLDLPASPVPQGDRPEADAGFGPGGFFGNAFNIVVEAFGRDPVAPDVAATVSDWAVFSESVSRDIMNAYDRQPPLVIAQAIRALVPPAGRPFSSAGGAVRSLQALRREMATELNSLGNQLSQTRNNRNEQDDVRRRMVAVRTNIDRVDDMLSRFRAARGDTEIPADLDERLRRYE